MKNKNKTWIYPIMIMGFVFILTYACKKDDTNNNTSNIADLVFNESLVYGTIKDYDNNVYKTIKIGTQTWMAENLRTTHYANGKAIPEVIINESWATIKTGAYSNYNNDINYFTKLGNLYNFYAVFDTSKLCPIGWHVPTDIEWSTLSSYLGGDSIAGGKLKEAGLTHWNSPNTNATNLSGFTAVPNSFRDFTGAFFSLHNNYGYWWSSSKSGSNAYYRSILYDESKMGKQSENLNVGFSVRCLRDSI
jgi:uncharacterized protein (TIGR02145 family)